ncbi:MAG: SOS response-associated peptidase [Acidobacteriota bacterium]|nr:SOS response-associated peptidase [Acidobacteriota bacterium]
MCGRFTQKSPSKKIAEKFKVEEVPPLLERYNVAPMQKVLGIRESSGGREATLFKWGLVPRWAKDPSLGNKLINARSETITEKPSFREAFRSRRILVPAEGFYEWARRGDRKRPFYFLMKDKEPFAIAGLWERWEGGDEPLETCTLLTTEANELLAPYHDRMPVILRPKDYDAWLDPEVRRADLLTPLLRPYSDEEMTAYAVSGLVNNPSNENPRCVEPLNVV